MELTTIAFLESYSLENSAGIMGAVLVTDTDTKPIEFRVTAPIKPTNFQKTLYGDVLLEHILVELIGVPLLEAIKEEVDIIVVRDPLFLGLNNKQGVRVLRVYKEEEGPARAGTSSKEIASSNNGTSKVLAETLNRFENELPEILDKLNTISESRHLVEPFERLKVACEQVQSQKGKE
ncbi:MAG: hypothetical protein HND52_08600 [Ignavibacteriae bacterium]|jgi:hypothetical protein|nr:hypothetical protein [Ignavibacteriota bacterium]NOG98010.1 hypothetical protein [Ignavibacteriota bacterium]